MRKRERDREREKDRETQREILGCSGNICLCPALEASEAFSWAINLPPQVFPSVVNVGDLLTLLMGGRSQLEAQLGD